MRKCKEYCDRCGKEIGMFDNLKKLALFTPYKNYGDVSQLFSDLGEYCKSCRKSANKTLKIWRNTHG